MKLKNKLGLSAISLVVIIIAGISIFLFIAEKQLIMKEKKQKQITTLKSLAHAGKEFLITKNRIQLINYINQIKGNEALVFAEIMDVQGKILAHTDINSLGKIDNSQEGIKSREKNELLHQIYSSKGEEISEYSLPIIINRENIAVARVGYSKAALDKQIKEDLKKTARLIQVVAVAALILGIIGAMILALMITGPIKKMADGAALIGQGKLDTEINVETRDELGSLAADLNKMAQKLKELDELKQDFVSSVTHELRSPLNSLNMYFDLFFKKQLGEITPDQKEALSFMQESTVRLANFINDLLDTAKIERGKMEVVPEIFNISDVVNSVVKLYIVQSDAKNIKLESQIAQNMPRVYADPNRVAQILNNLVNNAIKFTPEKGRIDVKIKPEDDSFIKISVTDTGTGIPHDQLDSVFNKFEQLKGIKNRTGGPKGTGLGLAIVRGLVEAQGGKIWVESEVGKGSTFYFTVPMGEDV